MMFESQVSSLFQCLYTTPLYTRLYITVSRQYILSPGLRSTFNAPNAVLNGFTAVMHAS